MQQWSTIFNLAFVTIDRQLEGRKDSQLLREADGTAVESHVLIISFHATLQFIFLFFPCLRIILSNHHTQRLRGTVGGMRHSPLPATAPLHHQPSPTHSPHPSLNLRHYYVCLYIIWNRHNIWIDMDVDNFSDCKCISIPRGAFAMASGSIAFYGDVRQ